MEHQHQARKEAQLTLKYDKRRYDGGNEIELIRLIEAKQALQEAKRLEKQEAPKVVNRKKTIWEAALLGPMEIAIGLVGILTSGLAIATFKQQGKLPLVEQSQLVMKDCVYTLVKGMWHLITTPVQMARAAWA